MNPISSLERYNCNYWVKQMSMGLSDHYVLWRESLF
ncbi:unnamed protein product [Brassica rapa subsp. narinosa]